MTRLSFAALAATVVLTGAQAPPDPSLDRLLACHHRAVGGAALRAVQRLEYDLSIEEPGMSLRGRYRAVREGNAGRMRIDVFTGETRVFSEWWDGRRAWQLPQDADTAVVSRVDGSEALRHGMEHPGHLWTLADMPRNGHAVALAGRDTIDGVAYHVVKLTLVDGFTNWHWLNPGTCQIERSRNFRAFHPDQDAKRKWIETVFDDFQTVRGVTRPHRERTIDLATGATIGTGRILALRLEPPFDPDSFAAH
ncbi:MAG: hypothetical protein ACREOF_22245 [Gemmatimonadales bacterium]